MSYRDLPPDEVERKKFNEFAWKKWLADRRADAEWFMAHPGISYRIRLATKGEELVLVEPPLKALTVTIVRYFRPGVHLAYSFPAFDEPPAPEIMTKGYLAGVWRQLAEDAAQIADIRALETTAQMINELEAAGSDVQKLEAWVRKYGDRE